ncbi:MAG: S41 family peptidase, partial [Planctomycetota bacterium]
SYRDLRGVDWTAAFAEASPTLEASETPAAFAREAARLLARAGDLHVTVRVGDRVLGTASRSVTPNCDLARLDALVPGWKRHNDAVATGRFEDGVGYVAITTWSPADRRWLDPVYAALDELAGGGGLVVDVRLNSGGDELLARDFAACFVPAPAVYSRNAYRDPSSPDGFTRPIDRVVEPRKDRTPFPGKVAVLMGVANMSSCESFLLMMKQVPSCRTFGGRSYGSSGNPKPHELGNGVTAFLSSWKDMCPCGVPLEGVGIYPDEEVKADREALARGDPVLDAALAWLRE